MQVGIFGPPGTGKSTVFRCLVGTAGSPGLGAREQEIGTVKVPDARLDYLSGIYRPRKTTPAEMVFVDLPNLPEGKLEGGTAARLRNMEVLSLVLRGFTNPYQQHPPRPEEEFAQTEQELILCDLAVIENRLGRMAKEKSAGAGGEKAVLENCRSWLEQSRPARTMELNTQQTATLRGLQLLSLKSLFVLLNTNEDNPNQIPARLEQLVAEHGGTVMCLSAAVESEIAGFAPEERAAFLAEIGQQQTGRERFIRHAYLAVGLISFLTTGEDECRAWTIRKGTPARKAAGVIHSDIERGFIRAEVVSFDDFQAAGGSEAKARAAGRYRLEGKDYLVQDGDIINFRFNV